MGLAGSLEEKASSLSRGMLQRLDLSRFYAQMPGCFCWTSRKTALSGNIWRFSAGKSSNAVTARSFGPATFLNPASALRALPCSPTCLK
jgi:hypothetical protein